MQQSARPGARTATIAFIAFAIVVGGYLAMRPTVIRGDAAARMLEGLVRDKGVEPERVECDHATPVGVDGARVGCRITYLGDTVDFDLAFRANGQIVGAPAGRSR